MTLYIMHKIIGCHQSMVMLFDGQVEVAQSLVPDGQSKE